MKSISLIDQIFDVGSVHEIASTRSGISAVIVNAVSGMFLVAAPAILLLPVATVTLAALLVLLFGPLIGFICSSVYSRLEWFVGKRLGGKASLDDLYRIFALSFLPLGLALLLYPLVCFFCEALKAPPEIFVMIIASIPSVVIGYFSLRKYFRNVIAVQQFTRRRGAVSVILTFALFLTVTLATVGFLWLFTRYGLSQDLKAIL